MTTTIKAAPMMHSPPHPGEILRELYLAPMRVTIVEAAKALGVTSKHVSAIVCELQMRILVDDSRIAVSSLMERPNRRCRHTRAGYARTVVKDVALCLHVSDLRGASLALTGRPVSLLAW